MRRLFFIGCLVVTSLTYAEWYDDINNLVDLYEQEKKEWVSKNHHWYFMGYDFMTFGEWMTLKRQEYEIWLQTHSPSEGWTPGEVYRNNPHYFSLENTERGRD